MNRYTKNADLVFARFTPPHTLIDSYPLGAGFERCARGEVVWIDRASARKTLALTRLS